MKRLNNNRIKCRNMLHVDRVRSTVYDVTRNGPPRQNGVLLMAYILNTMF
jgi:hypothetical protein